MNRLTQKDQQGRWELKGVPWERLHKGSTLTQAEAELLYGALTKLMRYEDSGLMPDEVEKVNGFVGSELEKTLKRLQEEQRKHRWIPTWDGDGEFPKAGKKVLLSFSNFSSLAVGRYEEDEEGGAFYEGNDDRPLTAYDLYVNAWMPLPDPYTEEEGGEPHDDQGA